MGKDQDAVDDGQHAELLHRVTLLHPHNNLGSQTIPVIENVYPSQYGPRSVKGAFYGLLNNYCGSLFYI